MGVRKPYPITPLSKGSKGRKKYPLTPIAKAPAATRNLHARVAKTAMRPNPRHGNKIAH